MLFSWNKCLELYLCSAAESDCAAAAGARAAATAQLRQNAYGQSHIRAMHPLFFSLRLRLYSYSTSVGEHGGFSREMSAFYAGDVAEREHHGV